MATTTSIIVLLKFFASRQNSAIIDFGEFCEYLKRYSEHHLEEQPSLVVYLSDTPGTLQKELEKLVHTKQVLLISVTPEKRTIIVIPFFIALGEPVCLFLYDNITAGTYLKMLVLQFDL